MTECRFASLPWFAGCFWLGLSWATHHAARGAARAGWLGAGWVLLGWTDWLADRAIECAREGGAE